MKGNRIHPSSNRALVWFASSLLVLASCSIRSGSQEADNLVEVGPQEVMIGETETDTIFVTMNASFTDEEKCREAMETIVNDAHAAYGVNSHFWFRSEDGKSLFVVEQYEDERALRQAVRRFTSARVAFFRSIKVIDVSVYGDVSFGIKVMFAPLGPNYMGYYGGYSKSVSDSEGVGIQDHERDRVFIATSANSKDESREAMEELVGGAYAEPGNRSHFWAESKDGETLFVLEQYADEKALIDHLVADPDSRAALLEAVEVGEVTIYGADSDEVKEKFAPFQTTYMSYYGGYSK